MLPPLFRFHSRPSSALTAHKTPSAASASTGWPRPKQRTLAAKLSRLRAVGLDDGHAAAACVGDGHVAHVVHVQAARVVEACLQRYRRQLAACLQPEYPLGRGIENEQGTIRRNCHVHRLLQRVARDHVLQRTVYAVDHDTPVAGVGDVELVARRREGSAVRRRKLVGRAAARAADLPQPFQRQRRQVGRWDAQVGVPHLGRTRKRKGVVAQHGIGQRRRRRQRYVGLLDLSIGGQQVVAGQLARVTDPAAAIAGEWRPVQSRPCLTACLAAKRLSPDWPASPVALRHESHLLASGVKRTSIGCHPAGR